MLDASINLKYESIEDHSGLDVSAVKQAPMNIGETTAPIQISNSMDMDERFTNQRSSIEKPGLPEQNQPLETQSQENIGKQPTLGDNEGR